MRSSLEDRFLCTLAVAFVLTVLSPTMLQTSGPCVPLAFVRRSSVAQGYERTVVENSQVIIDQMPDPIVYGNQRGIRLDDGDPILRDTTVSIHRANGHGINVQAGTNGATVERCQVNLYEPEIGIRVTGTNPEIRENAVNLHGFTGGTVLSGVSPGRGVAVNRISRSDTDTNQ